MEDKKFQELIQRIADLYILDSRTAEALLQRILRVLLSNDSADIIS